MVERILQCPFCADEKVEVIVVRDEPAVLAMKCSQCGALVPSSHSPEPANAVHAWNQRMGRLTVAK